MSNRSQDPPPADAPREVQRDPETGMFDRIREWNDVFPWLRLGRVMRIAGSPPLVLLTFLILGIWWLGLSWMAGEVVRHPGNAAAWEGQAGIAGYRAMASYARLAYLTSPSSIYSLPTRAASWRLCLGVAWSLLVWTPVSLLLLRQGALLTAGRSMMGLRNGFELAFSRMLRAYVTALVPTICVATIALAVLIIGMLGQWIGYLGAIQTLVAVLVALIAILCGLLAFGSHFAIPLSWAALSIEQNPDPLDSLSRGYEYLFRRPLQLAGYLILALVMMLVIGMFASGVTAAALTVVEGVLGGDEASESMVRRVALVLGWFPVAMVVTLGWGLVGGIYLMLRRDAGGQEVEDIWTPPLAPIQPLPSLPNVNPPQS